MLKKIWNVATAPVRFICAMGALIYFMFAFICDKEAQRELDDFNGIREGE